MKYVIYALAGVIAGVAGGMGMGGGTLLIPLLTLTGVSQHAAQAINLAGFVPMAIVALALHVKNKLVDFKGVLWAIVPGAILSAVFALTAKNIDSDILKRVFGGFLIILAGVQFFSDKIAFKNEK